MFHSIEQGAGSALRGIRVLTVDNYFAGNYGPLLMAFHGAEVVKVEQPGAGDPLRNDPPYLSYGSEKISHGELRLLRDKASVALDIRSDPGYAVLKRLIAAADVFWTNLRAASAERLKIDYGSVRACNESIVYASLTGFGLPGESSSHFEGEPAFDINIQALTGLMARNSDEQGVPQYNGVAVADQVASVFATLGVVMALLRRRETGRGGCVDVAMFDSMIALNEKTFSLVSMDGKVRPPRISATNSPFGAYRASDGYVAIGVGGTVLWKRFCKAIGRDDLLTRTDLDSGEKRVRAEQTVIRPIVEEWLRHRTVGAAISELQASDVPASAVLEVDSPILRAQARRRGVVRDVDLGAVGRKELVYSPILISDEGPPAGSPPSALGDSTRDVMRRWIGMNDREIDSLLQSGVIAEKSTPEPRPTP
jgi:CoA:oxalate CoA-transferase